MQKCKQCEWEFPDDTRICPYCGHPVEPEDQRQKRRFNLRWHQNTFFAGVKRAPSTLVPSQPRSTAPSKKHPQGMILVITLIVTLALGTTLVVLAAKNGLVSGSRLTPTAPPDQSLIVNPPLLDFGQVAAGSKPILSVIVKKRSVSPLAWQIAPASVQWLEITLRPKVSQSSNLREDTYDVTANTSKLDMGKYSALLSFRSDKGSTQRVPIKIQVIAPNTPPQAKLRVNPLLLDFGKQIVGNQQTLLLTMSNSGGRELRWTAEKGQAFWLTLDQSSGSIAAGAISQSINVKMDTSNLTAGQHSAMINFVSNGGNASVNVTLVVVSLTTPKEPTVSSISPNSGPATGSTAVVITGVSFTDATAVSFGSIAATGFTVISDTQITAVSPAGNCIVDVTISTPRGQSTPNSTDQFTYISPLPLVTSINPVSGPSTGGTSVTITGTGFTCAASVSFDSMTATGITPVSDTQLIVVSPAGSGTVNITITTPSGTSAASSPDQFTYIPLPSVSNVSPNLGPSWGGSNVIITGTGFTGATSVSFGSMTATVQSVSDTQIIVNSPADTNPAIGDCSVTPTPNNCISNEIVDVQVTTPGGTSVPSAADHFTYNYQSPIQ